MADYQSLLARAVANLPEASSPAKRQAIYERARKALLTQLRTLRPPLPESDIEREEKALDDAIAAVEAKFGASDVVPSQQPPAPGATAAATQAPPPGAAQPQPAKPAAAPPAPASTAAGASARPAASAAAPPLRSGAQESKPAAVPLTPRPAPSRPAAPIAPAPLGKPVAPAPPVLKGVEAPPAPKAPPVRAERPAQPPPDRAQGAKSESSSGPASLAGVIPADQALPQRADAPPVLASRKDDEAALAAAPDAPPIDVDRPGAARSEAEGQRPQAPTVVEEKRKSWPWLALAVVLGVVLSIAAAAIVMRQKPQDLAIAPPESHEESAPPPPAKIAQRAEPAPSAATPSQPPAAAEKPPQPAGQTEPAANPPAENPSQLPGVPSAAMLIASPDNPQKPIVNLGSTVWSTIPPAPGQPDSVAVKAEADIPDLKMHATMILRKNTDPTLQATHTIDLKFAFADGAPFAGFKDAAPPQMRKLNSTADEALSGAKVKISDDYFLFALAKSDADTARNLDLMQSRAWFDFPLLLNDNRIAKLVFQKSTEGEAMLDKAFDAWK